MTAQWLLTYGIELYRPYKMLKYIEFSIILITLSGCSTNERLRTEFLTDICLKPFIGYRYHICHDIHFKINEDSFVIPANFETDLASIPRIAWPILAPSHSSLIKPAVVHDWFYRKTCDFTRHETDLIFYHMLKNNGISTLKASMMYYAVRLFGWNYYNEDYCDDKFKGLDKEMRGIEIASLHRHSGKNNNRIREKS